MDLSLTESQRILVTTFRDFFDGECPASVVRASEGAGFDPGLWDKFALMGAPGMGASESVGGLGLGLTELCLVATQVGRSLAPLPFAEVAVAGRLLSLYSGQAELASELVAGRQRVSLVPAGQGGRKRVFVPSGGCVDHVLALCGEELILFSDSGSRRGVVPKNLGSGCPAPWDLSRADGSDYQVLARGDDAVRDFHLAQAEWKLLLSAQLHGLAQRALEIGADYANSREQFGQKIGAYQAISHPLADCATRVDGAELLVWEAAWAATADADRFILLSNMACVFAAETAEETASVSLHTHGGYGFAEEYDIQLYYRRACAWSLAAGGVGEGLKSISRLLDPLQRGEG